MTSPSEPLYREIVLSKGQVALVDATDYDWLMQWKWHVKENRTTGMFYAMRGGARANYKHGKDIWMHREILGLKDGDARIGDHREPMFTLDNRRQNLRIVDAQQSACNRRKNSLNTSGLKGVHFEKSRNRWRADIRSCGVRTTIGRFLTAEEAYAAYCEASVKFHGEYGRVA